MSIFATLALLILVDLGLNAYRKIQAGQALDTYHSVKLIEWSYLGAFITVIVFCVALLAGLLLRAYSRTERWRFIREVRKSRAQGRTSG